MANDIILFWLPEGVKPLPSLHGEEWRDEKSPFPSLYAAVSRAFEIKVDGRLPWIRAGSGKGSAVFNYQGISLLEEIYREGVAAANPAED